MAKPSGGSESVETLAPDLCIIGAGTAGLSVASGAAALGASVVLVEKGRMGGERLDAGCVASGALVAAGRRAHDIRGSVAFGIGMAEPEVDFARVRQHIAASVAAAAPMVSPERYTAMGVRIVRAEARFADDRSVIAGNLTIRARRFVIATGSQPDIPDIPGLDQVPFLTSETVFDLSEKPAHLVIVGGGPTGVEISQAYRRLGVPVTIVEKADRILGREDPEMAAAVSRALRREGVVLQTGRAIARIEPRSGAGFVVMVEGAGEIAGSHLLVATGRRPIIDGLDLDAAGIKARYSGIVVDRGLRTTNARVYAIGDCAGGMAGGERSTHVANHHAGLVLRNALFRWPAKLGKSPLPRVTYTDPELASVGLGEAEAREQFGKIRILRWSFADNARARVEHMTEGHVKAIATPGGRILGCAIAGPLAGELIMPWVMAISKGLRVSDMAGLVYPYPTFSEVTKGAAVEFLKPSAQNPWIRRLTGLVRRFG